jgi:Na+/H+-dicarboxylate symporter
MILIYLLLYITAVEKLASLLTMVVYLPLTFLMIWGGITYRKEIGSYKNYGQAFLTVFIISITATFLFDTFGYILFSIIDPELPMLLKKKSIESATLMMEKFGTPDDKMKEALQRMEEQDYTPSFKSQLIRYATSLGVGAFFSALIALFVRRGNEQPLVKAES